MAQVLPLHSHMSMDTTRDNGTSAPLPNPPFVFPTPAGATGEASSHTRVPSAVDSAGFRRSAPRSRPQRLSLNALPAFDFSPAASNPSIAPPSPPRSPARRTPPAYHSVGHKRNGSEFVGGDITNGGPMLVSTSPTKSESSSGHRRKGSELGGGDITNSSPMLVTPTSTRSEGLSLSPANTRLGPPTSRRGHAHRRSGAVSSHDLSMILKPPTDEKAGSAPTTPSDSIFQPALPPGLDRSTSQPVLTTVIHELATTPTGQGDLSLGGQPRPRARFADAVEYIPRPLSTISSETSSSMSTIRASHSVSNSISSVVSAHTLNFSSNTNQTLRRGQNSQDLIQDQSRSRPRTAEPLFPPSSGDWEPISTDAEATAKRPSTAPSRDFLPKRVETSEFMSAHKIPTPTNGTHDKLFSQPASPVSYSAGGFNTQLPRRRPMSPTVRPRTSPEPKVTKRQRKGRSWVGLLSRKARQLDFKEELERRSATPPLRDPSPEAELSLDDINFDEETTYIMETGTPYTSKTPGIHNDYTAWKPRESSSLSDLDNSESVLDIDEALGASDAPSVGPSFEETIGVAGPSVGKRLMHSSGATGSFAGPGMHYHRRAESAPEMEAIDHSRFGFPRLGSNPAMAIEEEEEEEDDEDESKPLSDKTDMEVQTSRNNVQGDQVPGLGVNIVEADTVSEQPMQRARRRPAKDPSQHGAYPHAETPKLEHHKELSPVEIVGADEEPRFSVITKSSDEFTITPTLSHDPLDTRALSAPGDFAMPTPALTYATSETPSAISSPDFTRTSFDHPRMHTATSSITDRATLSSSRAGDHGLGLHSSVDDVPSLTSSASTMSAHPTRISSSANSAADRSLSLSAAVPARTRPVSAHKRLSLASLSRLAGSTYNKSKLNIEESAPVDMVERTQKKKGNRISRMMKFWKSKEKLSSS